MTDATNSSSINTKLLTAQPDPIISINFKTILEVLKQVFDCVRRKYFNIIFCDITMYLNLLYTSLLLSLYTCFTLRILNKYSGLCSMYNLLGALTSALCYILIVTYVIGTFNLVQEAYQIIKCLVPNNDKSVISKLVCYLLIGLYLLFSSRIIEILWSVIFE